MHLGPPRAVRIARPLQLTDRPLGDTITEGILSLADRRCPVIDTSKARRAPPMWLRLPARELTSITRRGTRGLSLLAASQMGSPNENELLPQTVSESRDTRSRHARSRATVAPGRRPTATRDSTVECPRFGGHVSAGSAKNARTPPRAGSCWRQPLAGPTVEAYAVRGGALGFKLAYPGLDRRLTEPPVAPRGVVRPDGCCFLAVQARRTLSVELRMGGTSDRGGAPANRGAAGIPGLSRYRGDRI